MTQPLPYQPHAAYGEHNVDLAHLKTLSICHYVYGGIAIAFSSIFIIHVVMGILFLTGTFPGTPPAATPAGAPAAAATTPPPPAFIGWMFVGFGSLALLLGWTSGICTILSGRCLARQRSRTFSLVMAGVNCLSVPIGTTLGVFTFIILSRPSVQALYQQQPVFPNAFAPPPR